MSFPKIFIVEGNIGAGKSTFLKRIKENLPDCQVIFEPVEEWEEIKDETGTNTLQHFYRDPKKYSYLFQSMAFITRFKGLRKIDRTKKYVFIERSIFSDKNIFATNCYNSGLMEQIEWMVYNKWFSEMSSLIDFPFTFVYLKCSPSTSELRISNRNRQGESSISTQYLTDLYNLHENWLTPEKAIIVDGELDFKEDDYSLKIMVEQMINN